MARLKIEFAALKAMWIAALSVQTIVKAPGLRGLPPEMIALLLRMTLPVAPKLSDMLIAIQASGSWHHVVASVMA